MNARATRFKNLAASLAGAALATALAISQEPPSGPPDIQVSSPPPFSPENPISWIIPPFNNALPESTTLGEGQRVTLRAVSTDSSLETYQWFKDGLLLPGKTRDTLQFDIVTPEDGGIYRVDVGEGSSLIASTEIRFLVIPLSEIDELFEPWLSRFFTASELDDPSKSGRGSDPDGDGITNLVEYAFGLNPIRSDTPPELQMNDGQSATPVLAFTRAQGRDNLDFRVEGSSSLTNWTPLTVIAIRVTPDGSSSEFVEIEVDWNLVPDFPRFMRLAIDQEAQEP